MKNEITKIINQNKDIFGNNPTMEKINIGFTNTIYKINNKYILKLCTDVENEPAFKNEINFYVNNKNNPYIPALYKYNTDKKVSQYMYEILEKIEGESLYNIWPKLSEKEREEVIRKLTMILKSLHQHVGTPYDWSSYIRHHVQKYLINIKEKQLLSKDEIELIEGAINYFDKFLYSNKFVFIHNDLHFDNIFYNKGELKIIDFERSMIAPIDKELDIFFRMIELPWKYASLETEKLTNKKDYKNIKKYLQKYYPELVDISNLNIRLAIYDLRDYLKNYYFYKEEDTKNRLIKAAKKIIKLAEKNNVLKK